MQVQLKTSVGSRDAQILGVDFTKYVKGTVLNLSPEEIDQIKTVVGKAAVSDVIDEDDIPKKPGEASKAKPAKEPSEAELDKLTDPKKGK